MKVRPLLISIAAAFTFGANAFAQAPAGDPRKLQASPSAKFLPLAGRDSVGLSLGRLRNDGVPCGATAFTCNTTDNSVQLAGGSMVGKFWGVELAYLDMGRVARGGTTNRAQGVNLSLVGKAPVWESLNLFGKLGTTYGRTETSAPGATGLPTGFDRGFGLSFGAGVSYDFTPRLSATLAWDSHDFRFPGTGRDPIRSTSLGLQYRY